MLSTYQAPSGSDQVGRSIRTGGTTHVEDCWQSREPLKLSRRGFDSPHMLHLLANRHILWHTVVYGTVRLTSQVRGVAASDP